MSPAMWKETRDLTGNLAIRRFPEVMDGQNMPNTVMSDAML
jgi:hypothetical protein